MTDDNNSFRGKVYSDFNEAISGYDLYGTDEWGHEELESIVSSFEELIKEDKVDEWLTSYNKSNENVWGIDYKKDEFMALYKVFKLCMDNGGRRDLAPPGPVQPAAKRLVRPEGVGGLAGRQVDDNPVRNRRGGEEGEREENGHVRFANGF